MKTLFLGLWATVLAVGLAGQAVAVPLTYTFEGEISGIKKDETGLLADMGMGIGSSIRYVLEVDFERSGETTAQSGEVKLKADDALQDYFYTDYLAGTSLIISDGYFNEEGHPNWIAEYNYGYDALTASNGMMTGNSLNDLFYIYSREIIPSEWRVGTQVSVEDRAYGPVDEYNIIPVVSKFEGELILTEIQGELGPSDPPPDPSPQPSPPPAPEPGTLWLLGLGIAAGLGFCKRRDDHAA